MDSDLDAFSPYPADDSVTALAFQPTVLPIITTYPIGGLGEYRNLDLTVNTRK